MARIDKSQFIGEWIGIIVVLWVVCMALLIASIFIIKAVF